MNKMIVPIISLVLLALGGFYFYKQWKEQKIETENLANWQEFIPKSSLFKVLLPHPPQYAKDFVSIPNSDIKRRYDLYASEKIDGTIFLISVITYPSELDPSVTQEILPQNIEEFMQHKPDNHLTKLLDNLFQGHKSVDFGFENGDLHVEGKALQVGKIVYLLSYITRKEDFNPKEYHQFIDSFELLNKNKNNNNP